FTGGKTARSVSWLQENGRRGALGQRKTGQSQLAGRVALPEAADVNGQSVVKVDPDIMSGAPCFAGTRVPIQNLIDYLEGGDSIDEFLEDFPSVQREQVISFLEE